MSHFRVSGSRHKGRAVAIIRPARCQCGVVSFADVCPDCGSVVEWKPENLEEKMNKSEFIRNQPMDMPAREVIALAAERGEKISSAMVYVTRSKMRSAQIRAQRNAETSNGGLFGPVDVAEIVRAAVRGAPTDLLLEELRARTA